MLPVHCAYTKLYLLTRVGAHMHTELTVFVVTLTHLHWCLHLHTLTQVFIMAVILCVTNVCVAPYT